MGIMFHFQRLKVWHIEGISNGWNDGSRRRRAARALGCAFSQIFSYVIACVSELRANRLFENGLKKKNRMSLWYVRDSTLDNLTTVKRFDMLPLPFKYQNGRF
jgi:hypothetical protein